tara:strand:+ start:937 stop:1059 length:123 start_codon:yes stop_codon:yes gene_type:complete
MNLLEESENKLLSAEAVNRVNSALEAELQEVESELFYRIK